jgi:hypothetical protein
MEEVKDTVIKGKKTRQKDTGLIESIYKFFSVIYDEQILKKEKLRKIYPITVKLGGELMKEEVIPYKCTCGGKLKKSKVEVEFFGIDFGLKDAEVCTSCGCEYLNQETLEEIEKEVKKRKIFALERKVKVTKSGNSLVIRIPPDIADFINVHYKSLVQLFPIEKGRLEVKVIS